MIDDPEIHANAKHMLERVRNNLWLLGACRNWRTVRAMKERDEAGRETVRRLDLRALPNPLLFRSRTSDISVAWEIFQRREYECTRGWQFETVVDCGANVGMFMAFASMKLGDRLHRYVGVEADRSSFAILQRQAEAAELADRSLLLPAAVWDEDGEVRFDDRGPSWGRHVSEDGGASVHAMSIDSILDAAGLDECDLLKLDIEGGERAVLPRMPEWGPRVRTVVAELHDGLDYAWFSKIARNSGFEPFPPGELFRAHPSAIRIA